MSGNQTTENFLEVMRNFKWPEPEPIFYRLYHDDQGRPLFYSMEDLPGAYIEVDQSTYVASPYNVKVQNQKLIIMPANVTVTKLHPDAETGVACHVNDICVVVEIDTPHQRWSKRTDEVC